MGGLALCVCVNAKDSNACSARGEGGADKNKRGPIGDNVACMSTRRQRVIEHNVTTEIG